jgi:hypothetical protein
VLSSLKQKVPYTFYIMPPKTAKVTAAGTGRNKIPDKLTDSEKKKVRWLHVFFHTSCTTIRHKQTASFYFSEGAHTRSKHARATEHPLRLFLVILRFCARAKVTRTPPFFATRTHAEIKQTC